MVVEVADGQRALPDAPAADHAKRESTFGRPGVVGGGRLWGLADLLQRRGAETAHPRNPRSPAQR